MQLKSFTVVVTLGTVAALTIAASYLLFLQKNQVVQSNDTLLVESAPTETGRNGPFPDAYKRTQLAAPDFTLVDQNASTIKLSTLRGRVVVLSFAFAHCAAVCPTLVKTLIDTSKQFGGDVTTLIVTLDPKNDTPATLAHTASQWKLPASMSYLSGDPATVEQVLNSYQVPHEKNDGTISHPALVYVIDREGRIAFTLNSPSPSWLLGAVQRASAPAT